VGSTQKSRAALTKSPNTGVVQAITVRPSKKAPVQAVEQWDVSGDADYGSIRKRGVTLIQAEHLPVMSELLGAPVTHAQTRRNLLVSGINLASLEGWRLQVGEVVLQITEICDPCVRMETTVAPGALAAMGGMGGWCAKVLTPGVIRTGDVVKRLGIA
jgi:MOSC domain-containing protein YiiM